MRKSVNLTARVLKIDEIFGEKIYKINIPSNFIYLNSILSNNILIFINSNDL